MKGFVQRAGVRVGLGVLAIVLWPSFSSAVHVFDPPWVTNPTDPFWGLGSLTSPAGVTRQGWEFAGMGSGGSTTVTENQNPFGLPQLQLGAGWTPQFEPSGTGLTGVWTWHTDGTTPMTLIIPNDPRDNPYKDILFQYTSDKSSSGPPGVLPSGTITAGGIAQHPNGGTSDGPWYTYSWNIHIEPNPSFEIISISFPSSTNIEEVWVESICHVPEPASAGLLMIAAGAGLLRRRVRCGIGS